MLSSPASQAPPLPYSALDSQNPEDLWRWMDQRRAEGMEALSIPHNGNGSDGTMFERTMWNGQPIDRAYAELRARNEPLVEITQVKGQSETMPLLSPNDEFAGFEVMTSYIGATKPITRFEGGYVRDALKRGLEIEAAGRHQSLQDGLRRRQRQPQRRRPVRRRSLLRESRRAGWRPERRGSVPPRRLQRVGRTSTPPARRCQSHRRGAQQASPASGRKRTRASRCLRRCGGKKHSAPPARASAYACLPAMG